LSFIVDRVNYRRLQSMIEIGERLGADSMFFCNFLPSPYRGFKADERMIFSSDSKEIDFMKDVYSRLNNAMKKRVSLPNVIDRNSGQNGCNTYFTQIRVDGEMRASSCSIMLLNMEGNGHAFDKDVWNNAFFRKMRNAFMSGDSIPPPCRVCPENRGVNINA
ncbi:MAG: hypothetical protein PHT32_07850, partial [Candidatus Omnitrophica bacterium]|nr:hypothetical protein [Candidatus Omnitrophota bacterium]